MVNPKQIEVITQLFKTVLVEGGKQIVDTMLEEGKRTVDEIMTDAKEQYDAFLKDIQQQPVSNNVDFQKFELLNSSKLIALAKESKVEGANEVYVWKIQKDNGIYINLAYGKDKELLVTDKNKFVIIKAEALSADLLNMFEKSELVILK